MRTAALLMRYKLGNSLFPFDVNSDLYKQLQQDVPPLAYTLGHAWYCIVCVLDMAFNLIVDGQATRPTMKPLYATSSAETTLASIAQKINHNDAWYGVYYNLTTQAHPLALPVAPALIALFAGLFDRADCSAPAWLMTCETVDCCARTSTSASGSKRTAVDVKTSFLLSTP